MGSNMSNRWRSELIRSPISVTPPGPRRDARPCSAGSRWLPGRHCCRWRVGSCLDFHPQAAGCVRLCSWDRVEAASGQGVAAEKTLEADPATSSPPVSGDRFISVLGTARLEPATRSQSRGQGGAQAQLVAPDQQQSDPRHRLDCSQSEVACNPPEVAARRKAVRTSSTISEKGARTAPEVPTRTRSNRRPRSPPCWRALCAAARRRRRTRFLRTAPRTRRAAATPTRTDPGSAGFPTGWPETQANATTLGLPKIRRPAMARAKSARRISRVDLRSMGWWPASPATAD